MTNQSLYVTACRTHVLIRSQDSRFCGSDRSAKALPEKEKVMLRVIFPTAFGFVALMSVWGATAATYMM